MYEQVIIIRNDLKMGKGKIAAQACHASIESFIHAQKICPNIVKEWLRSGQKKVVLKVNSEKELLEVFKNANIEGLPCSLIRDAGRTQLEPGTITAVGIGPEKEDNINKITGKLKLL
ncbi:MAG: peptidyl-tRNA hydrolase, family [Methanothermococcus sp.]|jgi:PTH2 family peptidyl-tRNA hydrolase|uniref:peptidyl-tRNA hydrolase Pth2 n=1 Tax=Methanothermococcus TaxID=155862 RepID=UPI00037B01A2|nr:MULTISPECIES: peptidyl-tRNA hydrolase Pth2 [Methanothermococcus]MDK2790855.1 peptidyl-tRNA hydrolase, family [Methanothermococcus sp.]MDK2987717.1 peptidyl-tRNA hydrolase, family [Methanothermococcus sp.]